MPLVHADPDKLRQYAKELRRTGDDLDNQSKNLLKRLNGIDWDDKERQKFEQDLSAVVRALGQFASRLSGEYAPSLERKAKALEDFRR